jgi:ketosteroid isomerase-like protein
MRLIPIFFYVLMMLSGCSTTTAEDIMKVDRDFSKRSAETGMKKAFLEFASDTAVLLRPNSMPIVGKTAIAKSNEAIQDEGFTLTWEPLYGDISKSGDLGYTCGIFTMVIKADSSSHKGTYLSIWKKQTDGSWKWVMDTGNEGI